MAIKRVKLPRTASDKQLGDMVNEFYPKLYKYAFDWILDADLASDIVAEKILEWLEHADNASKKGPFQFNKGKGGAYRWVKKRIYWRILDVVKPVIPPPFPYDELSPTTTAEQHKEIWDRYEEDCKEWVHQRTNLDAQESKLRTDPLSGLTAVEEDDLEAVAELTEQLESRLDKLSDEQLQDLRLRHLYGLTHEQIAEVRDITPNAQRQRSKRTKDKLNN